MRISAWVPSSTSRPEVAQLPTPPYTVAVSPAWGYAGLYCPGTPRAPLRCHAWFAAREPCSTCHEVSPLRSNAARS